MKQLNRLSLEKSPYLLQHAHNPVDWFPWGQEAFEKARLENKPLFLSIGYSTCHWCHVMERESFENEAIASFLNQHFVSIKVDREERPDVDEVYMTALTQVMRQQGGWPLSMCLTPELKPFWGGTYFPPVYFQSLLKEVVHVWEFQQGALLENSEEVTRILQDIGAACSQKKIESHSLDFESLLSEAFPAFQKRFDFQNGGFGSAPKFPQPSLIAFLLRYFVRSGKKLSLEMAQQQLDAMARGGIYDHLGGGFARYSTDDHWLIPHFEKMLYDNAQLLKVYTEAYQLTQSHVYREIILETGDYVLREMQDPCGGFYSAQDADSEGVEGKYFFWTWDEVAQVLRGSFNLGEVEDFCNFYGITQLGSSILHRKRDTSSLSCEQIQLAKKLLFSARSKRVHPSTDDKVLVSWNGLMISALAYAGRVLNEDRFKKSAKRAADFIISNLYLGEGELKRRWREGETAGDAFLEDYAYFAAGLLDLYESIFDESYLLLARDLQKQVLEKFYDSDHAGFFLTRDHQKDLIYRSKAIEDGAIPSPGSIAVLNGLRLDAFFGEKEFFSHAEKTIKLHSYTAKAYPTAIPNVLIGIDYFLGPSCQVVFVEKGRGESSMRELLNSQFLPRVSVLLGPSDCTSVLKGKSLVQGRSTAYVCKDFVCYEPATTLEELKDLLKNFS